MKRRVIMVLMIILILIVITIIVYNNKINEKVVLKEYDVYSSKISENLNGYKIFVISDLHNSKFANQINKHITETEPNSIFIVGDMVNTPNHDLENTIKILDKNADVIPTYIVSGNHESQNKHYWDIVCKLKDHGAVFVDDKQEYLWKDNKKINLIGLMDPPVEKIGEKEIKSMKNTIKKYRKDSDLFTIVACHRPNVYPFIKNEEADLLVSGHVHGGLIRLPLVGGILGHKEDLLLPTYDYGYYDEGNMKMIISGGCNNSHIKRRIFNPPEVLLVTLKKE